MLYERTVFVNTVKHLCSVLFSSDISPAVILLNALLEVASTSSAARVSSVHGGSYSSRIIEEVSYDPRDKLSYPKVGMVGTVSYQNVSRSEGS